MGFQVTCLQSVGRNDALTTYVYVLEPAASHVYSEWLTEHFDSIGFRLGAQAGIIRGYTKKMTGEIISFLERWLRDDERAKLQTIMASKVTFAVTHKPLPHTGRIVFFPIGNPSAREIESTITTVTEQLIHAITTGRFDSLLSSLATIEVAETGYDLPISDQGFAWIPRLTNASSSDRTYGDWASI